MELDIPPVLTGAEFEGTARADLQDLARSLGLETKGTANQIKKRIRDVFGRTQALNRDPDTRIAKDLDMEAELIGEDEELTDEQLEERGGQRDRYKKLAQRALEDDNTPADVKRAIRDPKYTPIGNDMTLDQAAALLHRRKLEGAKDLVWDEKNGLTDRVRFVLGRMVIREYANQTRRLKKQGLDAEANKAATRAGTTVDILSERALRAGQAIQSLRLWGELDPVTMIAFAQRRLAVANKDQGKGVDALFKKVIEQNVKAAKKIKNSALVNKARRLVGTASRQLDIKFNKLVLKHYSEVDEAKATLTEKIMRELELPENKAANLAAAVEEEIETRTRKAKERLIEKFIAPTKQKGKAKSEVDRIIEFSNAGAFDNADFSAKFFSELGNNSLSGEDLAKINTLAGEAQEAAKGRPQDEKILELLNHIHSVTNPNRHGDRFISLWYANALSGVSTQKRNLVDTAINTVADVTTMAMQNKENPITALSVMLKGAVAGTKSAFSTLQTGRSIIKKSAKIEAASGLEADPFTGVLTPLNRMKWVGRAMQAEDEVFYKGALEARAWVLARSLKKSEGLKGAALSKAVDEVLHGTKEQKAQWEAQAKLEGFEGNDFDLRVLELAELNRSEDIQEEAHDFGGRATHNYQPEGAVGKLVEAVETATRAIPALRIYAIPFTRIVANVTVRSMMYTPLGGFQAAWHYDQGRSDRATQAGMKAVVGSLLMLAAFLKDAENEDDEDPAFAVYGNGPRDRGRRNQLRSTGWRPWSFKVGDTYIDYRLSPLAVAMGFIGSMRDAKRFDNQEDEEIIDKITAGVLLGGNIMLNQSFLSGAADLMSAFGEADSNPKSAAKALRNIASRGTATFVVPNILRDFEKLFNPEISQNRNWRESVIRQVPFARGNHVVPIINALGEPAKFDKGIVFGTRASDPVWHLIAEKDVYVPMPGKTAHLNGERMTPDQYYNYVKISGKDMRKRMERNMASLKRMDKKQLQAWIKSEVSSARSAAKIKMLRLRKK